MIKPLKNKTAIVTGGSRGIGADIARALGEAGARVVVNYTKQQAAAEAIVAEIKTAGGMALALRADVSKADEVRALFTTTENKLGHVHILVNNAGVTLNRRLEDTSNEEFDRLFDINVKGVFYALREAASRLQSNGRIINISSSVTRLMLPTYSVYSATKGAVDQLTRVFAKEIGGRGITVNSVAPGPTNTELFMNGKSEELVEQLAAYAALGRIGEPAEIARVVLFLASEEAGWISGQTIGVNGGFA
jgi:3-oxoacyl-[acyl-carrier protein] reductase